MKIKEILLVQYHQSKMVHWRISSQQPLWIFLFKEQSWYMERMLMSNLRNKHWIKIDLSNPLTNQWGECGEMSRVKIIVVCVVWLHRLPGPARPGGLVWPETGWAGQGSAGVTLTSASVEWLLHHTLPILPIWLWGLGGSVLECAAKTSRGAGSRLAHAMCQNAIDGTDAVNHSI